MNKLIEILPNIYGVKVPSESIKHSIHNSRIEYYTNGQFECNFFSKNHDDRFKLLGFLTKDEISFDASEIVNNTEIDIEQYDGIFVATPRFWDYELESFSCSSSDESFRSAFPEEIEENEKYLILERL